MTSILQFFSSAAPIHIRALLRTAVAVALLAVALQTSASAEEKLSWQNVTSPAQSDMISALAITNEGEIFAATQSGALHYSTDNGQSWQLLVSDGSYGFGLTAAGTTVYRTTDQGATVSTDKGKTWQPFGSSEVFQPQTVFVSAGGTLFIGTIQSGVFRSEDGGKTWQQRLAGAEVRTMVETQSGTLFASVVYPADFGSGEMVADSSGIYRSTDGGTTWSRTGLVDKLLVTLALSTDNVLIAGSQEMEGKGRVFRSEDGGNTWNTTSLQDITTSLTAMPDGTFMATAANSGIYRSTDGGKTWTSHNSGIADARVMGMKRHPDGHLYAYDVWGALYRSSIPIATGVPVDAQQASINVRIALQSSGDALFIVTPTAREQMRITLFDMHGRVVAVPADGLFEPAEHRIHFSVRGLAAGAYFYRLETPSSVLSGSLPVIR